VAHHWSSQAAKVMRPSVGSHPGAPALGVLDLNDEALGVDLAREGLAVFPAGKVAVPCPVGDLVASEAPLNVGHGRLSFRRGRSAATSAGAEWV
jgi:hypothetical protein